MPSTTASPKSEVGPLLGQILQAQAETNAVLSAPSLEAVAKRMVDLADTLEVKALQGASETGERLVGAMVLLSGRLAAWDGQAEEVLLVDAVIVTPLGMRTVAAHLRQLGATAVHGAVVDVLQADSIEGSQEPLASLTVLSSG